MDSGWAAIIGSGSGVFTSLATTWLNARLSHRPNPADETAKRVLAQILHVEPRGWVHIQGLSNAVGKPEEATRTLLLEIGARGSRENEHFWGLVRRNPLIGPDGEPVEDPSFPGYREAM